MGIDGGNAGNSFGIGRQRWSRRGLGSQWWRIVVGRQASLDNAAIWWLPFWCSATGGVQDLELTSNIVAVIKEVGIVETVEALVVFTNPGSGHVINWDA
jgi:hypothetical protein